MGVAGPFAGIEQLLQSLEQLEHGYLEGKADDLAFLRDMLKTPEFKYLLKVKQRATAQKLKHVNYLLLFVGPSCSVREHWRRFSSTCLT